MSTFVLVHGAWCWEKVEPLLREAGHEVVTLDLPGHGEDRTPVADVTLADYTDRVVEALDERDESAVLVGHSLLGIVISQAAEQRPRKIARLVYLAAYLLRDGEAVLSAAENDTESLLLPAVVMSEDQTSATLREDAIKELLCADCSDADVERAKSRFGPEAVAPFATPLTVTEDNFGRVPRVYIETLQDRAVSPLFQKEMYDRLPCQKVISMDTSHSPFFSAPEELAGHLDTLAKL